MKEIVVISGKGGTGKTSLTGAFACLAENAVLADCDVDAADLHLLLAPEVKETNAFHSGHVAEIRRTECIECGACLAHCRFDAVKMVPPRGPFSIAPSLCEGCGVCVEFCPVEAVDFPESHCGDWYRSETRFGPMVHARLHTGAENSGKLVSLVRTKAKETAEEEKREWILIDGPPGIGCPVIASITGVDAVLIVTEPTLSGQHDLQRVLELTKHFSIPASVCINKWDINPDISRQIEKDAEKVGSRVVGKIPYSAVVTEAQVAGKTIPEYETGELTHALTGIWKKLCATVLKP